MYRVYHGMYISLEHRCTREKVDLSMIFVLKN